MIMFEEIFINKLSIDVLYNITGENFIESFNIINKKINFKVILDKVIDKINNDKQIDKFIVYEILYYNDVIYRSSDDIYKTNYLFDKDIDKICFTIYLRQNLIENIIKIFKKCVENYIYYGEPDIYEDNMFIFRKHYTNLHFIIKYDKNCLLINKSKRLQVSLKYIQITINTKQKPNSLIIFFDSRIKENNIKIFDTLNSDFDFTDFYQYVVNDYKKDKEKIIRYLNIFDYIFNNIILLELNNM